MSFHLLKNGRRNEIRERPLTTSEITVLGQLPYYRALPLADQKELQDHIKVFLAEKSFVGAQDFEVTAAMRVAIAAHACVLLLHRETDYYPKVDTIIVYPSAFVSAIKQQATSGFVTESDVARVGESNSNTGVVVFAWDKVLSDISQTNNGKDVVFHEFAHQLDGEEGTTNGAPHLPSRARYAAWAKVLSKEFDELDATIAHHQKTWVDPYANTNPAEFFAVVTEMFFKAPRRMRAHSTELYQQFANYFQQDPATYIH